MDGLWSSPDLVGAASSWPRSTDRPWPSTAAGGTASCSSRRGSPIGRGATPWTGARRNIHAHYDLGNDLYRLFLDESMTYSAAVFEADDQTLADAQRAKYRRLADDAAPGRPACTSSRSARAGAGSPCTRPASAAAGSRRSRSRASSTPSPASASARPGWSTSSTSSCATTATSRARSTRSCPSRCSRPSGPSTTTPTSGRVDRALRPGRPVRPPGHHLPRRRLRGPATRGELDPDVHLPGRAVPVAGGHRALPGRDPAARPRGPRHRPGLRPHAGRLARAVPGQRRRGPRPGLRRALHPDVGVLPGPVPGRLRDRAVAGPPDRAREGPRSRARGLGLSPGRAAAAARRRPAAPRRASRPAARRGARGPPARS